MKNVRKIQILITVALLLVVCVHLIWPSLKIDGITLTLIVVAVIPWLAPVFKSLELPGGFKFEYQDLERVEQKAKAAGLVKDRPTQTVQKYTFMDLVESDPQLALAGLRIELEKSLKNLAEQHQVAGFGVSTRTSLSMIINDMFQKEILTHQEKAALSDMVGVLNRAVHGEDLDNRVTQWVIDIGPQIMDSINKKIETAKNI